MKRFLLDNPFIYTDNAGYNGAIFIDTWQPLSENDFKDIYKKHFLNGISELSVYDFGKHEGSVQEIPPIFSSMITLRSAETLFE